MIHIEEERSGAAPRKIRSRGPSEGPGEFGDSTPPDLAGLHAAKHILKLKVLILPKVLSELCIEEFPVRHLRSDSLPV
jgi:hypothetical protein